MAGEKETYGERLINSSTAQKRFSVEIPENLHKEAKAKAAKQGKTLKDIAIKALKEFVDKDE